MQILLKLEKNFKEKYMLALEQLFSSTDKTFPNKMGSEKEQNLTPSHIAKEMVQAVVKQLPEDKWNKDLKILDIYCKSGILLYEFYFELFNRTRHLYIEDGLSDEEIDAKCRNHILENQLYGICTDPFLQLMSTRTVYGYITENSNIKYIKYFDSIVNNKDPKLFWETIKENFGEDKMKKFGVVIGNPPYNNDAYLDFVTKGHQLSSNLTCMITPAKWQAKTDAKVGKDGIDKNIQFREEIVPYMSDIVFYPDSHDIFDIGEHGGISYYIINKEKQPEKKVTIKCKNDNFNAESEIHDEINTTLLNRTVLSIIGKAGTLGGGFKQSLYVKNTDHGEETIEGTLGFKRQTFVNEQDRGEALKKLGYVEVMQGEKVCGYKKISELYTTEKIDKYKIITSILVSGGSSYMNERGEFSRYFNSYIIGPNQVPKGSFPVIRYFNTLDEAKSFNSYCNTKIFQFLFCIGVCGTTLTKEFFRFIPDPGKFDHIFTDQELYEKYNLTDEEIKIIESVIKERK